MSVAFRDQKKSKALNPLELELHRWLGATMWVLGLELRSSARGTSVLSCGTISPALGLSFSSNLSSYFQKRKGIGPRKFVKSNSMVCSDDEINICALKTWTSLGGKVQIVRYLIVIQK